LSQLFFTCLCSNLAPPRLTFGRSCRPPPLRVGFPPHLIFAPPVRSIGVVTRVSGGRADSSLPSNNRVVPRHLFVAFTANYLFLVRVPATSFSLTVVCCASLWLPFLFRYWPTPSRRSSCPLPLLTPTFPYVTIPSFFTSSHSGKRTVNTPPRPPSPLQASRILPNPFFVLSPLTVCTLFSSF